MQLLVQSILAFLLHSPISVLHGSPQLPPFSAPAVWGAIGWAELLVWMCLLMEWVRDCLMLWELTCWRMETKGGESLGERRGKERGMETLSSFIFQNPIWLSMTFSTALILLPWALPTLPSPWKPVCYPHKVQCLLPKRRAQWSVGFFYSLWSQVLSSIFTAP